MNDILCNKFIQCKAFKDTLMQSQNDDLIEDTNNEYWARGSTGNGMNILGMLLMNIRDSHKGVASGGSYRPPANAVTSPCYKCGEGNHNQVTCHHQNTLQCRTCLCMGHKSKHCPDDQ